MLACLPGLGCQHLTGLFLTTLEGTPEDFLIGKPASSVTWLHAGWTEL